MFECKECKRNRSVLIARCERRAGGGCPFTSTRSRLSKPLRFKGLKLALSGFLLFYISHYFNFLDFNIGKTPVSEITAGVLFLSFYILVACYLILVGFFLIGSKKLLLKNSTDGIIIESHFIQDYEFRTKIISNAKKVEPSLDHLKFSVPPSVLSWASKAEEGEAAKAEEHLQSVLLQTLAGLVASGDLDVVKAKAYDSAGKRRELTTQVDAYFLILRNQNASGRLEKLILSVISDWQKRPISESGPSLPSAAAVIQEMLSSPEIPEILEQELKIYNIQKGALTALQSEESQSLSRITEQLQKIDQRLLVTASGESPRPTPVITKKQLRIGLVVCGTLLFILWRLYMPVKTASSLAQILSELEDPTQEARQRALQALQRNEMRRELQKANRQSREALTALGKLLNDPSKLIRTEALTTLIGIDSDDVKNLLYSSKQRLLKELHDQDVALRRAAAKALGKLERDAQDSAQELIRSLIDPDPFVRASAAEALGKIGADPAQAVPALTAALQDKEAIVRKYAAEALAQMGVTK